MLSDANMMKIALDACVKMLGRDLVNKHKELCCCSFGKKENGLFSYSLGLDTKKGDFIMGEETPTEFCALVLVDPKTGNVTRDLKNSRLPS